MKLIPQLVNVWYVVLYPPWLIRLRNRLYVLFLGAWAHFIEQRVIIEPSFLQRTNVLPVRNGDRSTAGKSISYPESSGFLVSGWAPVETLGNSKKPKFFDWLPCNDFHCFTAEILR